MNEDTELLHLEPDSVSASGAWLFWPREPDEAFIRSLTVTGQIDPVLACRDPSGWSLLTGYKRLMACRKLGRRVLAREVRADPLTRGKIAFWSNWPRWIVPEECLPPARYFQGLCPANDLQDVLHELLGSFLNSRQLDDLTLWLQLPEDQDRHVLAGRLPLESGRLMSRFELVELEALDPFLAGLSWSRNKARQFLTWLLEASRREGREVGELIAEAGLNDTLQADLSPKDRLESLLAQARRLRYPHLTQLEQEFQRLQTEVRKATLWNVRAEPGFEGDRIFLTAPVASRNNLYRAVRDLEKLAEGGYFEAIWNWQADRLNAGPGET